MFSLNQRRYLIYGNGRPQASLESMEIKGYNLCQYFWRINAPRDDAIATRGNLRLVEAAGETRELRLDKITSFSHPEIGTVLVSES